MNKLLLEQCTRYLLAHGRAALEEYLRKNCKPVASWKWSSTTPSN